MQYLCQHIAAIYHNLACLGTTHYCRSRFVFLSYHAAGLIYHAAKSVTTINCWQASSCLDFDQLYQCLLAALQSSIS